ncbi:hypothetical protein LF817_08970 [Halobacillus sp. A1]|uniref:hypothetical protein n=1 Tax=Halobacillus sp. A1 TaxID=2880262 RepID=UPI0020A6D0B8|nr:hypothetical protein [Halobacillus sp. A1]MCP3031478.1 hypothetical protein [Halobacillus sp. A1]
MKKFFESRKVCECLVTEIIGEMGIGKEDVFLKEGMIAIHNFLEVQNENLKTEYQLINAIKSHFRTFFPNNETWE